MELKFDPEREGKEGLHGMTGIYVRAKNKEGKIDNADIAELDKESLVAWLASRDDKSDSTRVAGRAWRDNVILILLGHPR